MEKREGERERERGRETLQVTRATGQEGSGQEGHDGKQIYRESFTEDRLTVELLSWMPSVGSWENTHKWQIIQL